MHRPARGRRDASPTGRRPGRTDADRTAPPPPATTAASRPPATAAMTRSEEQLRVGTERVATTRARLVKYVVTEEVQITVPIRREEIRVEEVPLDAADDGPASRCGRTEELGAHSVRDGRPAGLPDEIILHTERPVVTVEVVPVERVRLRTEVVQGQETVTEQVQREQIVVDEQRRPAGTRRPATELGRQRRSGRKRNRSRVAATSAGVDVGEQDRLDAGRRRQQLAHRADDPAVADVLGAVARGPDPVAADDVGLVLDRPGLQQRLPVRAGAGSASWRARGRRRCPAPPARTRRRSAGRSRRTG